MYAKEMINECLHEDASVKFVVVVIVFLVFIFYHNMENERFVVLNICGKTVTTTIQVDINVVSQETQFEMVHMITIAFNVTSNKNDIKI